jgi:7-cyano-7-deazaguanine synthase
MSRPYKRALVILSGGQDSTTCLFVAAQQADEVLALTFDYGQRHHRELSSARRVYQLAEVAQHGALLLSHEILPLGPILAGTSPLVNPGENVETYASAEVLPGGIEKTFVPMRNALFLVLAWNRAVVHGCDAVYLGVSQEDYGGYPDCRAEFLNHATVANNRALAESAPRVRLVTPLLFMTKRETVDLARAIPGCMEALAYSHTCYKGECPPCGECHACLLRAKGFAEAGVADPLLEMLAGRA